VGLGLDGASYDLVSEMLDGGELPNLAELASSGSFARMRSSIPPVSTVAWASLFTGKNPGGFGVFGFEERMENSYDTYIPDRRMIRSETIYSILEDAGRRYVSINVPMTYPPIKSKRSVMVSSLLSPNLDKAASSRQVLDELNRNGYQLDLSPQQMKGALDEISANLRKIYARREATMLSYLRKSGFDLFIGVFTESDRVSHFAYDNTEYGMERVRGVYRMFDSTVGKIMGEASGETGIFIFSDHGFAKADYDIHLNRWLVEEGYLHLDEVNRKGGLSAMKPGSQAYALDSGRIYINLEGREPLGCIAEGAERDSLSRDLASGLLRLREPRGERALEAVHFRDDTYSGPFAETGPDLVVQTKTGIEPKTGFKSNEVFGKARSRGMHSFGDAILISNRQVPDEPEIKDCFNLLLGS